MNSRRWSLNNFGENVVFMKDFDVFFVDFDICFVVFVVDDFIVYGDG